MSGGPSTTWSSVVNDKKSELTEQGCGASVRVCSEAAFRLAFEAICKKYKERLAIRLLARLGRTYGHIIAFASAVGTAAQLEASQDLTGLLWWAKFAAIESGCEAGVKLEGLVTLFADLNCSVPNLGANLPRFPNDSNVQSPLQDLFGTYIDAYIFMVRHFRNTPPCKLTLSSQLDGDVANFQNRAASDLDLIKSHAEEAKAKFQIASKIYHEMLDLAEQNETIVRLQQLSLEQESRRSNSIQDDNAHPDDSRAQFRFRRRLGRGSFGDVSEVQEMSTEAVYARKLIHFKEGSATAATIKKIVMNEVTIMQKLSHQHIARVLFHLREPGAYSILMLPVADMDLLAFLEACTTENYPPPSLKLIYPWFGCLLDALTYAHKLSIEHRDIKPSNILIKDGQAYLADFGIAKDFTAQDSSTSSDYFVRGTPVYRTPETRPENPRGPPADIFALGCVFSEMLTVKKGKSLEEFRQWRQAPQSADVAFAFRENLPRVREWVRDLESDALTEQLSDQIRRMLAEDPAQRPTAQRALTFLNGEPAFFCPSH